MFAAIEQMMRRISTMLWRGRITSVNDGGNVQIVQVKLNPQEVKDAPRLAEYGFSSSPPIGSDMVMVCLAGNRSNGVVVATNHQSSRIKGLSTGEVAVYDNKGQSIRLTSEGIVITAPLGVKYDTPKMEVTGEVVDCTTKGNSQPMSALREKYNNHTHGGVMAGDSRTDNDQEQI